VGLERCHVHPRAESAAGAGDDDCADVRVVIGRDEQLGIFLAHVVCPCVQPVRTVEGEHGHLSVARFDDR
jgi:hypothetical protein